MLANSTRPIRNSVPCDTDPEFARAIAGEMMHGGNIKVAVPVAVFYGVGDQVFQTVADGIHVSANARQSGLSINESAPALPGNQIRD